MATIRRTTNIFVYFIALIVSGISSFLGFRGPSWARHAVGKRHPPHAESSAAESSPTLARAIAAAGPHAPKTKIRGTGANKKARRSAGGKKTASKSMSRKSSRERTASVSSL